MTDTFHYHKTNNDRDAAPQYMSREEIKNYKPYAIPNDGLTPLKRANKRMETYNRERRTKL